MRRIILGLYLLVVGSVVGQRASSIYYQDGTPTYLDYIYASVTIGEEIVVAAHMEHNGYEVPGLVKYDYNGNVVWSTYTDCEIMTGVIVNFDIFTLSDGAIYAVTSLFQAPSGVSRLLWKVDPETGNIEYITRAPGHILDVPEIVDVNENELIIARNERISPGAFNWGLILDHCRKSDGKVLEHDTIQVYGSVSLATDRHRNLYLAMEDTIRKYEIGNYEEPLWEHEFGGVGRYQPRADHALYVDDEERLIFISKGDTRTGVYRMDPLSGEVKWKFYAAFEHSYSKLTNLNFVDDGHNVYIAPTAKSKKAETFYVFKVNKGLGYVWGKQVQIDRSPHDENTTERTFPIVQDLAFDNENNLLITGYHGDKQRIWFNVKLSSKTGDTIFDNYVYKVQGTPYRDNAGQHIFYANNRVVSIGHSYNEAVDPKIQIISLYPDSGVKMAGKNLSASYYHHCSVIDIIRHNSSVYLLGQMGKRAAVIKYNSRGEFIWSYDIYGEQPVEAGHLAVNDENVFASVSGWDMKVSDYGYDAGIHYDYMHLFKLDVSTGKVVNIDTLGTEEWEDIKSIDGIESVEAEADSHSVRFVYNIENDDTKVVWSNGTTKGEGYGEYIPKEMLEYPGGINMFHWSDTLVYHDRYSKYHDPFYFILSWEQLSMSYWSPVEFDKRILYYDMIVSRNHAFLVGNITEGQQIITAIDLADKSISWERLLDQDSRIYKVQTDRNTALYVAGQSGDQLDIRKFNMDSGEEIWNYRETSSTGKAFTPYDLKYHAEADFLSVVGAEKDTTSSNGFLRILNANGSLEYQQDLIDQKNALSELRCIEEISGREVWYGGAYNRTTKKEAILLKLDLNDLSTDSPDQTLGLSVYPNPADEQVFLDGIQGAFSYSISDLSGKNCQRVERQFSHTISTADLPEGMYFLEVIQDGKRNVQKLVISH